MLDSFKLSAEGRLTLRIEAIKGPKWRFKRPNGVVLALPDGRNIAVRPGDVVDIDLDISAEKN